ncbi:MAG: hypothetical protein XE06_0490 [Anaerolineaceae bacterium 46_22]|nr:MAG: hypothetical protein XE06_0490 [Anaerolineaceae bacterium 46_22]
MSIILGHGAMAAQRTLNPLIQVRILVPRPLIKKALSTQESIDPDRRNMNQALGVFLFPERGFAFNFQGFPQEFLLKTKRLKDMRL